MSLDNLTHCPDCNYSLFGLPPAHRCPECGFEYDENTRVWRPSNPRKLYGRMVTMQFAMLTVVISTAAMNPQSAVIRLALGLCLAAVGLGMYSFWRAAKIGPFIAVTSMGLVMRMGTRKCQAVPWSAISQVNRVNDQSMQLQSHDPAVFMRARHMLATAADLLVSDANCDVRAFNNAVEAAFQRYRNHHTVLSHPTQARSIQPLSDSKHPLCSSRTPAKG